MSKEEFHKQVQIWYKNRRPKDPSETQVAVGVYIPDSDMDVLPGRVYFLYERNTYVLELGMYDDADSFHPIELYVDKLSLWILRKLIRRILALRCIIGLYPETALPKPTQQLLAPVMVPLSAITLPQPFPHKKENPGPSK